jgi:GMP synthase-like glutamine amidotransferase
MRNVAILRFSKTEGPAYFADWLDASRIGWELVPLDQKAAVPRDPRAYAGIAMMGGPMGANDDLTWIEPVLALLREAVAADVPVLGHCLGGQLLAKAMGAPVTRAKAAEIGWVDVSVPPSAAARDWFGGRAHFPTFQWHYDAFELPPGATRVLENRYNPNQAYVIDDRHIGMQCHVEMTDALVETWLASGASELPQASTPAVQSAADIRRELPARVAALHAVADDIYARWAKGLVR